MCFLCISVFSDSVCVSASTYVLPCTYPPTLSSLKTGLEWLIKPPKHTLWHQLQNQEDNGGKVIGRVLIWIWSPQFSGWESGRCRRWRQQCYGMEQSVLPSSTYVFTLMSLLSQVGAEVLCPAPPFQSFFSSSFQHPQSTHSICLCTPSHLHHTHSLLWHMVAHSFHSPSLFLNT